MESEPRNPVAPPDRLAMKVGNDAMEIVVVVVEYVNKIANLTYWHNTLLKIVLLFLAFIPGNNFHLHVWGVCRCARMGSGEQTAKKEIFFLYTVPANT